MGEFLRMFAVVLADAEDVAARPGNRRLDGDIADRHDVFDCRQIAADQRHNPVCVGGATRQGEAQDRFAVVRNPADVPAALPIEDDELQDAASPSCGGINTVEPVVARLSRARCAAAAFARSKRWPISMVTMRRSMASNSRSALARNFSGVFV